MDNVKNNVTGSKVMRCVLAALIALTSLMGTFTSNAKTAEAAESVHLDVQGKIHYAGYTTTWMYADGEIAYCGNPSAATPPEGNYSKSSINAISGRNAETEADLWFGYGSPGFDKSLWPSTWYDGSEMTNARYAALAHILLSDTFSSNGNYALFGCDEEFKSWCRYNVIGYGTDGSMINDNATGRQIMHRMGEVPKNFEAFMLYTGEGNQLILSFKYTPYGNIDLVKVSAIEEMCEGNPLYSLKGAEYTVYRNSGCTDVAGVITTDDEGYGKLEDLEPGDYWVKETKRAPGHALDPNTYKTTVISDETTRVNGKSVSDDQTYIVPKTTTGSGSSSGGYSHSHSYNETTHKCSCGAFAPTVVATIGNTNGYLTLEAAVAAAQSGDIVKLVKDTSENIIIPNGKTIVIDLNGKKLTNADSHTIVNNGNLTIQGSGTVDNVTHQKAALVNYGTAVLNGGTYTRSLENPENNKDNSGGNSYYTILNDKGGNMTINAGVEVTNVGHFSSMICNGGDANSSAMSKLTIHGGVFSGGINTVKNDELGELTITDGSFSNASQCVIMNWHKANISGGTFETNEGAETVLFTAKYHDTRAIGKLTLTGGTYICKTDQALLCDRYNNNEKYLGTASIAGGTFSRQPEAKYIAAGYEAKDMETTHGRSAQRRVPPSPRRSACDVHDPR